MIKECAMRTSLIVVGITALLMLSGCVRRTYDPTKFIGEGNVYDVSQWPYGEFYLLVLEPVAACESRLWHIAAVPNGHVSPSLLTNESDAEKLRALADHVDVVFRVRSAGGTHYERVGKLAEWMLRQPTLEPDAAHKFTPEGYAGDERFHFDRKTIYTVELTLECGEAAPRDVGLSPALYVVVP
jgi:hypothetical protein